MAHVAGQPCAGAGGFGLAAVLGGDLAEAWLLAHLQLGDLGRAEGASRACREALLDRRVLWRCAQDSLPGFALGPRLAETPIGRDARHLIAVLRRAVVATTGSTGALGLLPLEPPLPLPDLAAVEALAGAVQRASAQAAAHAAWGRPAHVFVARFRFPHLAASVGAGGRVATLEGGMMEEQEFAQEVAASSDSRGAAGIASLTGWQGFFPSEPVTMPIVGFGQASCHEVGEASWEQQLEKQQPLWLPQEEELQAAGSSSWSSSSEASWSSSWEQQLEEEARLPQQEEARLPQQDRWLGAASTQAQASGVAALELRLAWLRDSILVSVQKQALGGVSTEDSPRLSLDLRSVSPDLLLHIRGLPVDVDAGWLKGHGVCSVLGDRRAAAYALAEGLPCVVCVREEPSATMADCGDQDLAGGADESAARTLQAMHLEVSCPQASRPQLRQQRSW